MSWIVTLLVLALIAWFVFRWLRGRANTPAAGADPLEHDRDGLNRPLPGQRAGTEGEVHDAARSHVGGHLEDGAAGDAGTAARRADSVNDGATSGSPSTAGATIHGTATGGATTEGARADDAAGDATAGGDPHRVEASVRTQPPASTASPSITTSPDDDSATVTVPGTPDPASGDGGADADGTLSANEAARAARASENTGGTGTAVLAGIATAAGAAAAASTGARASDGADRGEVRDGHGAGADADRVNPPDVETAGAFDADGRGSEHASNLPDGGAGGTGAAGSGSDGTTRDEARTNAPVGDTAPGAAAREPSPAPDEKAVAAASAGAQASPDERTNAPKTRADEPSAGAPDATGTGAGSAGAEASGYRDRSSGARSNLVAGTVTLAVGGATAAAGAAVLEDGATPEAQAARLHADAGDGATRGAPTAGLDGADDRTAVREMMKILNLRDADATRLGVSKDDFARLWQGDASASAELVDEVGGRLRRMLG